MKKKTILTIALAFTMAFSSAIMANEAVKLNDANAKEKVSVVSTTMGDNWSDYFDYVTDGDVTFTPNQKNNNYDGLVYSTAQEKVIGENGIGLGVNITKPTTFTFKNKINLKVLTKNVNLFEIYANPLDLIELKSDTKATASDGEFSSFEIRLTDDDGNFIAIKSNFSTYEIRLGWVSAYTNELTPCGWQDKVNRNANEGTPVYFSYAGLSKNTLAYYFDYANMELWASDRYRVGFDTYGENGESNKYGLNSKELVRSFISNEFLANGEMPFQGFTSDEVTMTIDFPDVYGQNGANFIFVNVAGNALTGEKFNDNNTPTIFIDESIDLKNVPVAQKDRFYPLYDYIGFDLFDGDISSSVNVDVVDPDGIALPKSEIKGGFTPTKEGNYTVTYNLTDYSGNKANPITIEIPTVNAIEYVSMDVDATKFAVNDEHATISNNVITASVGEKISLAPYTCNGGSGILNSQIVVKDKAGYLPIYNNSFSVVNDGYTVITYYVTDYLGDEVTKTYYVNATYNTKPVLESVFLQRAIKQGNRVNINMPKAYDYYSVKGVKSEVKVATEISEDNGATYEKFAGGLYAIKNASTEKLLVKYTAKSLTGDDVTEKVYEIKVAKPSGKYNSFVGKDYFAIDGEIEVSYTKQPNGVYEEAEFAPITKGASMQFINPMRDNDANLTFNFNFETAKFNKFTVAFNGAYEKGEQVSIVVSKNDNGVTLTSANGSMISKEAFINGRGSTLTLKLSVEGNLTLNGIALAKISTYDSGVPFKGFTGNRIFTTITFDDFDEGAKVRLTDVGYTPAITSTMEDNISPTITMAESVTTYHDIYENIKIPSAIGFDALSPDIEVTFTLTDPTGEKIYENVVADKDYYFNLNIFGTYVLKYTTKDEGGNPINKSLNIVSFDNIAPIIEVNGQFKTKYKVNDTINIPSYVVVDNYYENVSSYVFITTPSYGMKTISFDGKSTIYKFQMPGRYTITYYAMDNAANYTVKEFTVYVE